MGQYYRPINIDKFEYLDSFDYNNGSKLTEHSYIGNNFVSVVEKLLSRGGAWYKCRLCWAGDYMDAGIMLPSNMNISPRLRDAIQLANGGGYGVNLYTAVEKKAQLVDLSIRRGRYLVNHTKKACIDLKAENVNLGKKIHHISDWPLHPLPLLTCSGNGRGGGDYNGNKMNIVGSWAGDVISLENKPMYQLNPPILFKENENENENENEDTSKKYQFVYGESENDIKQKQREERKIKREKAKREKEERERIEFEKSELAELLG